jgi:hypothetical protein
VSTVLVGGRCAIWAPEVTAAFGRDPRLLRMIAAVHEAGHAVVAATVGFEVIQARVGDPAAADEDADGVTVDVSCYGDRPVPLPDQLAGAAAGLQANSTWLFAAGLDANQPPYDMALNVLAGPDKAWCLGTSRQAGRPWLTMQHGIEGAWWILTRRWPAVLALADSLASRGTLAGPDLEPYLSADPAQHADAISSYDAWRRRTSHLWRRDPGQPAEA